MNYRLILKTLGSVLQIEAVCMLIAMLVGLYYGEDPTDFAIVIAGTIVASTLLARIPLNEKRFFPRDGIVTVALIWIAISFVGALPFYLYGQEFTSLADAIFESVSGFTTTGATILSDIESLPRGLLFWRSFTHLLGGMGVLVFAIAIMPAIGDRAHNLVSAESTGPAPDRLVSTVGNSSQILYLIYLALTLLETIALRLCGLPFFDSINSAMATAGTGGFAILNTSIAGYNNVAAEIVITVFMGLFSINFAVFFLL
ncbi:MAG: TrkH family potassium uptake protein, partial [Clostridia bacterium]|nr:TrkH family potassium uptake protein [Clostridia bacterium]